MKTVLILVEEDIIFKTISLGKSGDFAVINYFLQNNWQVYLATPQMLYNESYISHAVYEVQNIDYSKQYLEAMANEAENILLGRTPDFEGRNVKIKLETFSVSFVGSDLLLSRVMPQSLTPQFVKYFNVLAKKCKKTVQNIENICLYKDKVIPYLLQNQNLGALQSVYTQMPTTESYTCSNLSLETTIFNINESRQAIVERISTIVPPFCIKPFNLFGGLGVKVFNGFTAEVFAHIEHISKVCDTYAIQEKLVLVQKAVEFPEFGDIRAFFSFGRFLGAFKRFEPNAKIHNTMYGGAIVPVCNANLEFSTHFAELYREPFTNAINDILHINNKSDFLQNEFICGYDLLLTQNHGKLQFVMTETNIACPTGFSFLDAVHLAEYFQKKPTVKETEEYFALNANTINIILDDLMRKVNL